MDVGSTYSFIDKRKNPRATLYLLFLSVIHVKNISCNSFLNSNSA